MMSKISQDLVKENPSLSDGNLRVNRPIIYCVHISNKNFPKQTGLTSRTVSIVQYDSAKLVGAKIYGNRNGFEPNLQHH